MKCPVCKDPNLLISERKGIEIDYCPDCRGIWLDRGELDKLLEKSREGEFPQAAPNPKYAPAPMASQHSSGHHQKSYKRKKSFLEELFD